MGNDAKRVNRLRKTVLANAKNCRFEDLERLVFAAGFKSRDNGGSHVYFSRGNASIVVPRRKPVKEVYVKYVLKMIPAQVDSEDETA